MYVLQKEANRVSSLILKNVLFSYFNYPRERESTALMFLFFNIIYIFQKSVIYFIHVRSTAVTIDRCRKCIFKIELHCRFIDFLMLLIILFSHLNLKKCFINNLSQSRSQCRSVTTDRCRKTLSNNIRVLCSILRVCFLLIIFKQNCIAFLKNIILIILFLILNLKIIILIILFLILNLKMFY